MLKVGLKSELEMIVTKNHTATYFGSGNADVFSTPFVVAFLEKTSNDMLEQYLDEGIITVGTAINISHIAATPVGMKVRAIAEITQIEGKKIIFNVTAYDEVEKIAEGTHSRFMVNKEKFQSRCDNKGSV